MSLQNQNDNYLGNPNIKKDGIVQNWTETEVTEYAKCMKSSIYFVEKYAKIISLDKGLVPFKLYWLLFFLIAVVFKAAASEPESGSGKQ